MVSGPYTKWAKRLDETDRRAVSMQVDGVTIQSLEGDTLLTAILLSTGQTGTDAYNRTKQAGFCLMGACQSCWVRTADGQRLLACETEVEDGLKFYTSSDGLADEHN